MESKGMDVSKVYVSTSYIVSATTVIVALGVICYLCFEYSSSWILLSLIVLGGIFGLLLSVMLVNIVYFICWFGVCRLIHKEMFDTDFDERDCACGEMEYDEKELSRF